MYRTVADQRRIDDAILWVTNRGAQLGVGSDGNLLVGRVAQPQNYAITKQGCLTTFANYLRSIKIAMANAFMDGNHQLAEDLRVLYMDVRIVRADFNASTLL